MHHYIECESIPDLYYLIGITVKNESNNNNVLMFGQDFGESACLFFAPNDLIEDEELKDALKKVRENFREYLKNNDERMTIAWIMGKTKAIFPGVFYELQVVIPMEKQIV